jgi:hypothetical protein
MLSELLEQDHRQQARADPAAGNHGLQIGAATIQPESLSQNTLILLTLHKNFAPEPTSFATEHGKFLSALPCI